MRTTNIAVDVPQKAINVPRVVVIPVNEDNYPLTEKRTSGVLSHFSSDTLILELPGIEKFPACGSLIMGLLLPDETKRYAGVLIHNCHQLSDRITITGQLGGPIQEILEHDSITPEYCPTLFQYTLPYPFELLDALADLGALVRKCLDRILVCPECYSLVTFRIGCPHCGSSKTMSDRLVHHFACSYVGFLNEFETSEGFTCPKCRARYLVIGTDCEYTMGVQRCIDCSWAGSQLKLVSHCMHCNARFPGREATILDLISFHAQRFDPLALDSIF